jgi:hypothetical protein
MASTAVTENVERPYRKVMDATGAIATFELADELDVRVDVHKDGRIIYIAILLFSDYAGLEAEWIAGSVTTVLDAAVVTHMNAMSLPSPERLTAAQKASVGIDVAIA